MRQLHHWNFFKHVSLPPPRLSSFYIKQKKRRRLRRTFRINSLTDASFIVQGRKIYRELYKQCKSHTRVIFWVLYYDKCQTLHRDVQLRRTKPHSHILLSVIMAVGERELNIWELIRFSFINVIWFHLHPENLVLFLRRKFDMVEGSLRPRNVEHFRISEEGILIFFRIGSLIRDSFCTGKQGSIHIADRQFSILF